MRPAYALLLALTCRAQQDQSIVPVRQGPPVVRSYLGPLVPPARFNNSGRLGSLIRAGNLYLSVQDAIALALENNLDLEIDRYGPLLAASAAKRAEAGGPYRGVPNASAQVASVDSGLGVAGSIQAAGLGGGGGGGGGGSTGGVSIQQVGQLTPNLDPVITNSTTFSHLTYPQPNTVVSQTDTLIDSKHTYSTIYQQGLISGGTIQITDYEQYIRENAPSDIVNPAVAPYLSLSISHPLLQGFGVRLNDRDIRISKMNAAGSRETFRSQVLDLVASVLNLYWDLVSANDTVRARQESLGIAQKFLDDTRAEIAIGSLARVRLPAAEAEVASRGQDLLLAQAALRQQEIRFKDVLSRTEDPALESAAIVPLDRIDVPQTDDLPPLRKLVTAAMEDRPDVAVAKIRDETQAISALGTTNPLLPSLTVGASVTDRGAAGTPQPSSGITPSPEFVGGYGKALGQIVRRDYPTETARVSFSAPFRNRSAQGDYGIDQLQLRQSAVSGQRDNNQIVVDISKQLIALRQARSRYTTAVEGRQLQEQLLKAEQEKFAYGTSAFTNVILAQHALVAAQTAEINALADYAHARVSLDQVTGRTLEVNRVSLDEALNGKVARESGIPPTPSAPKN